MTLMETEDSLDVVKLESQREARAFLRERFLRVMAGSTGKECNVHMFENTDVTGTFRGVDVDLSSVLISDMKTHIGTVPHARLRAQDVIWLHFPNLSNEAKNGKS